MAELDELRDAVHALGREVSELKPVVMEVHSNMPRIVAALETLARLTERQEADAAEHKRLHYRITAGDNNIAAVKKDVAELREKVTKIKEAQVACQAGMTAKKEKGPACATGGMFVRAREKAAEKVIEIVLLGVLGFLVWLAIYHLPKYPVTAPIIEQGRLDRTGGEKK